MIRVTIELESAISASRDRVQARLSIWNIGGSDTRGNYKYTIHGKGGQKLHEGTIYDFPRKQKLALDLVARVLIDARGVQ